jgi:hypothetical protein
LAQDLRGKATWNSRKMQATVRGENIMLRSKPWAAVAAAIAAFGLMTIQTTAAPAGRHHNNGTVRSPAHAALGGRFAPRGFYRHGRYAGGAFAAAPPYYYYGRGFSIPQRGIIDDACNLPSSGCWDYQRDTQ